MDPLATASGWTDGIRQISVRGVMFPGILIVIMARR
jgi:hypothetical protein